MLSDEKLNLDLSSPRLVFQFLINRYNQVDLRRIKDIFHDTGMDELTIKTMRVEATLLNFQDLANDFLVDDLLLSGKK